MQPSFDDLESRTPVWCALSDLFLDTDVSLLREFTANTLAKSPYSMDELEDILRFEVYPVCKYNLLSVAGEWAGFDEQWLVDRIHQRRGYVSTLLNRISFRFSAHFLTAWQHVKSRILEIREQSDTEPGVGTIGSG